MIVVSTNTTLSGPYNVPVNTTLEIDEQETEIVVTISGGFTDCATSTFITVDYILPEQYCPTEDMEFTVLCLDNWSPTFGCLKVSPEGLIKIYPKWESEDGFVPAYCGSYPAVFNYPKRVI